MCSAACLSERNHLVRRISKTDIFKGSVPRSNWYCPNRRWIINISESAHSSHKKQCNGMITFSIHHQWWWWRWKSCHRSLVSPPGWLSSGDLRWQFACRLQPPSAPTRGPLESWPLQQVEQQGRCKLGHDVAIALVQHAILPPGHFTNTNTEGSFSEREFFSQIPYWTVTTTMGSFCLQLEWALLLTAMNTLSTLPASCSQCYGETSKPLEEPTYAACLIFSLKSHHPNLGEHNSCLWFQN